MCNNFPQNENTPTHISKSYSTISKPTPIEFQTFHTTENSHTNTTNPHRKKYTKSSFVQMRPSLAHLFLIRGVSDKKNQPIRVSHLALFSTMGWPKGRISESTLVPASPRQVGSSSSAWSTPRSSHKRSHPIHT